MPAKRPTWGRVAGIFAASLVTLVGVLNRLDPDELLVRITVTALLVAVITNLMARFVGHLSERTI